MTGAEEPFAKGSEVIEVMLASSTVRLVALVQSSCTADSRLVTCPEGFAGENQPKVSELVRGRLEAFSLERLARSVKTSRLSCARPATRGTCAFARRVR